MASLDVHNSCMSPISFNQYKTQNDPEKNTPSNMANATRRNANGASEFVHLSAKAAFADMDGSSLKDVNEKYIRLHEVITKYELVFIKIAETDKQREILIDARKSALPALARAAPSCCLEDCTIKISDFSEVIKKIENLPKDLHLSHLRVATFGHMEGNLHPTFLFNENNEQEYQFLLNPKHKRLHYTKDLKIMVDDNQKIIVSDSKKYLTDLIILNINFIPNKDLKELRKKLDFTLDNHGFMSEETLASGIFGVGTIMGALNYSSTISKANELAIRIISILSNEFLNTEFTGIEIDVNKCGVENLIDGWEIRLCGPVFVNDFIGCKSNCVFWIPF